MQLSEESAARMVGALSLEVAALRAELAALRAELAVEVRTRRVVVVDADGNERVYSEVPGGGDTYAQWRVEIGDRDGVEYAAAVMHASSECAPVEASVHVMCADAIPARLNGHMLTGDLTEDTACRVEGGVVVEAETFEIGAHGRPVWDDRCRAVLVQPDGVVVEADA